MVADHRELARRFLGWAEGQGDGLPVAMLAADASNRTYYRISEPGRPTVVAMRLADDPLKSEEVVDGERPDRMPFLDVAEFLHRGGLPVPEILHVDLDNRLILLEDLGDLTVERALARGWDKASLYGAAVELAADLHAWADRASGSDCVAFRRHFGAGLLRWELEHFQEWGLVARTGQTPTPSEQAVLNAFYEDVVGRLVALPQGFVHRDFQSRNLMVQDGRLRLIDFQDALMGPYLYDLVALLRDSYVAFDPAEVKGLLGRYREARAARSLWTPTQDELEAGFYLQALQRKLKDAGRFVYIDRVKKNPKFLPNIPRSLRYVREAFDGLPEYSAAREVLARYCPEVAPGA